MILGQVSVSCRYFLWNDQKTDILLFTLHIALCFFCHCRTGCSDTKSKYCVVQYAMKLLFEWLPRVAAQLVMSV